MKKPFTLVEVLIAMSVLSVFLLGLMQFYSSTETVLNSGIERTELFERARIAMDMMANDLACMYYSQTDSKLKTFAWSNEAGNKFIRFSTVRPEKLTEKAKTNIVGVQYKAEKDDETDTLKLVYSFDNNGDTFDVSNEFSSFKSTDLLEGVNSFQIIVRTMSVGGYEYLPYLVEISLEVIDSKTLRRIKANPSAKSAILNNANLRRFRRTVIIDRGQPKPKS